MEWCPSVRVAGGLGVQDRGVELAPETIAWAMMDQVGRYVRFTLADVEQFTNAGRVDPIEPWTTYANTHRAS